MFQPAMGRLRKLVRYLGVCGTFILVLAVFLPATASAQAPNVKMEVTALYEGNSKYGEWLPVVVNLQNDGSDISGLVQVSVSGSDGGTKYAQRTELPTGSRKQVTVYVVPNNFSRVLLVEFVSEKDETVLASQETSIQPVPNIRFVAAAITAGGSGLQSLADVNFRGEGQRDRALLVPLTLDTLPERPEALRSLDLIVLSGVDTGELSPRQRATLVQYVSLGGILVIGGGPEASRVLTGIPDKLVPVTLTGEIELDALPALETVTEEPVRVMGPYPAAEGEPVAGATVALSQEGLPLVVEKEVGDGVVFWFALDPALTPFDAWAGTADFWKGVMADRTFYPHELPPDVSPRQMGNDQLRYALENLPSLDLPSLRLLVPLLAAYILIVGPVNYFALRRSRRLELAWVTIPITTIIFSVGAYGLGYQLRGSDVIVNQVAVIEAAPGTESAYIRSMVGVFSPSRRSYDIAISGEPLLSTTALQRSDHGFRGNSPTEAAFVIQGEPALVDNMTVNQWAMGSVMAESFASSGYGMEVELKMGAGEFQGTITNRSQYHWRDVVVAHGSNYTRLGDVAPGAKKAIELNVSASASVDSHELAWRLFEGLMNGSERDRQGWVRQQIVQSQFSGPHSRMSGPVDGSQPVLLAWLDTPPMEVDLGDGTRPALVSTTLLTAELPIQFSEGEIVLPGGMIKSRTVRNDGGTCGPMDTARLAPDFREAEIHFQLPAEVSGLDPTVMALQVMPDHGWEVLPDLSLYDFENDSWAMLADAVRGRNIIEEPDPFVSQDGVVRLQIINDNDKNFERGCISFDISLQGQFQKDASTHLDQS